MDIVALLHGARSNSDASSVLHTGLPINSAHRAPACKSCQGHRVMLLLPASRGTPSTSAAAGGAQRTLFGMGGVCAPPPAPHGGGATITTTRRRPHRDRAPLLRPHGVRGARDQAMGGQRGQTPDPGRPVLPSRCDTRGGWGWGGGARSQSLTHNPLA